MVRHQVLVLASGGSNPSAPAIFLFFTHSSSVFHSWVLYYVTLKTEPKSSFTLGCEDTSEFNWHALDALSEAKVTPFVWHVIQSHKKLDKLSDY